ncbi:Asp23/Gls24 family envelope stress response protein [Streptosporangium sp. NPDC002721]|uniref:Asp23/Gls24 family envelope stress response protein n=1 Tax=Streptosporangium sp. NPDC002721 TaxID=3366188 RepID=UPI00368099EC
MTEASTVNRPQGDEATVPRARTDSPGSQSGLITPKGTTTIDSGVVSKIAGLAAREIPGVYNMGAGAARALGAVRGMVGADKSATQGVSVEVGERQAAADLEVIVEYGIAIPDLAAAVRRNVITAVERMTGLEVTEVNIKVSDVHMPGQDRDRSEESSESGPRVQ